MSERNRRTFSNALFGEHKDIKQTVYMTMLPTLALFILSWFLLHFLCVEMQRELASVELPNEGPALLLSHLSVRLRAILLIGYGLIAGAGFYVCMKINVRLIGPMTPIKRFVTTLTEGEYSERMQLRKDDFLQEVSDSLNQLAASLEGGESAAEEPDP